MTRDVGLLQRHTQFDLLVIGGGINGAAIAHEASRHGLKVALIEKQDFASGASSRTTKLIHGGLRYLENLEFGLVRESLKERYIQLKATPNLVKPLSFIIAVYSGDRRPLWLIKIGVFLYDLLAGQYLIKPHKNLKTEELIKIEPRLKKDGLIGGVSYYDAQMDDARLCIENVLSAATRGAVVANYVEAVSFLKEQNKAVGVVAKDVLSGDTFKIRAKRIICAAGPWTDILLKMDEPDSCGIIRATKGAHILYKEQLSNNAILVSTTDRRIFFIIPWKDKTLIGTTDTDYAGSPDEVLADEADIEYLISQARRLFPDIEFKKDDIITTYAGLRPLARWQHNLPSAASRRHIIFKSRSGIIFVAGGKYTTYRKVSQDVLRRIIKVPSRLSSGFSLHCGDIINEGLTDESKIKEISLEYGVEKDIVCGLIEKYGVHYKDILALTKQDPSLKERILPGAPYIRAQIVYSIRYEMAVTSDDIFLRRLSLWDYRDT